MLHEALHNEIIFYFQTNISKARNRVTLASLYLGTGTLEQDLVIIAFIIRPQETGLE